MSASLSRRQRRDLDRRADRLLSALRGALVAVPAGMSPRSSVILLAERFSPVIVQRTSIVPALHALGLWVAGLADLLAEIARCPADDGSKYPAIVLLDGFAEVAFVESFALSRGGQA